MKKPNILYGIVIIAVVGILSGVVGYTFPTQTPTQQIPAAVTAPTKPVVTSAVSTAQKDGCGCCAERRARLAKQRQQARERKQAKQGTVSTNAR